VRCVVFTGEGEIGFAEALERRDGVGTAIVPRRIQTRLELLEATLCNACEQFVAVTEMAIRRRWADASRARGLGKSEARRPLLRDQVERGLEQCFLQISVVVGALRAVPLFSPA